MSGPCARCGIAHEDKWSRETAIQSCARCGEDHDGLTFVPFQRPPMQDDESGPFATHWARCPTTGDPILVICAPESNPKAFVLRVAPSDEVGT